MKLSILDFACQPSESIALAKQADRLGFHRYWVGEHHTSFQCPNPLLLSALILRETTSIRAGSGATSVMLRAPYLIAEDARMITGLFGGRLDLGLAPALACPPPVIAAITGDREAPEEPQRLDRDRYSARLLDTIAYARGGRDRPDELVTNLPTGLSPAIWILGLNQGAASVAGQCGAGFCTSFHHGATADMALASFAKYRDSFRPSTGFPEPRTVLVVSGICADGTDAEWASDAERLLMPARQGGRTVFSGSPAECVAQLRDCAQRTEADEVMILSFVATNRLVRNAWMFRALAEAWGLAPQGPGQNVAGG